MKNPEVNVDHIDYKDVETLRKFVNQHARLQSRKRTGVPAHFQRSIETAVKRARFMGLLPYISR